MDNNHNNVIDSWEDSISVREIMEHLTVSRNFIYTALTPSLPHKIIDGRAKFHLKDVRMWLMLNASFSRQTVFIREGLLTDYDKILDKTLRHWRGLRPLFGGEKGALLTAAMKRGQFPHVPVKPFDFWDLALVTVKDAKYTQNELLYRDMFLRGGIKISLGRRKTWFYVPPEEKAEGMKLMPAVNDMPNAFLGNNTDTDDDVYTLRVNVKVSSNEKQALLDKIKYIVGDCFPCEGEFYNGRTETLSFRILVPKDNKRYEP